MQAEEPKTYENLNVSEDFPMDAMLAFMLPASKTYQTRFDVKDQTRFDVKDFWPQHNTNIAHMIFEYVLEDSAQTRLEVGLVSPPSSPRQTPEAQGAPGAPSRPPRLARILETAGGSQASGQPLATTVRALFADVPAVVPDA